MSPSPTGRPISSGSGRQRGWHQTKPDGGRNKDRASKGRRAYTTTDASETPRFLTSRIAGSRPAALFPESVSTMAVAQQASDAASMSMRPSLAASRNGPSRRISAIASQRQYGLAAQSGQW